MPLERNPRIGFRPISGSPTPTAPPPPPSAAILGVPLAVSSYDEVVAWMDATIDAGARATVTAAAVNLVMSARDDPSTMQAVLGATLAVPDGQPLVWALRLLGHNKATRVYGPDLMAHFCAHAAATGTPIYLYGGRSPEALDLLWSASASASPDCESSGAGRPRSVL